MSGLVSLVGAGPGAPDLLTLRAVDRLRAADAVVVDRLVDEAALAHCRCDVARFDVGKLPGGCGAHQDDINALLIQLARAGLRVVRLKGGDPFVFGRGGEEALALARAGVSYEVIPGVSAALAAPAAAGIPVTHRGLAHTFTVSTGTGAGGADLSEAEMRTLALGGGTLVLLMGVKRLERTVAALLRHGRSPGEPAALIERATWSTQAVVTAPLGEIVDLARRVGICPPATLVVGPTVALANELGRRDQRALSASA